jgi:hypothetical protein
MTAKVQAYCAGVSVDDAQRKAWLDIAKGTLPRRLLLLPARPFVARLRLAKVFLLRGWHPAEPAAPCSAESRLELRRSTEEG